MSAEARTARALVTLLLACTVCSACGRIRAPRGFLPTPAATGADAFGGWVEITYSAGGATLLISGEMIAVGRDSIWVMEGSLVHALASADVRRARLTGFDSQPGHVVGYAALGVLTTLSNGFFLVLSAPAWLITGTVASRAQARAPVIDIRGPDLTPLARYARFPQGMPPGLDPRRLQPRSRSVREHP